MLLLTNYINFVFFFFEAWSLGLIYKTYSRTNKQNKTKNKMKNETNKTKLKQNKKQKTTKQNKVNRNHVSRIVTPPRKIVDIVPCCSYYLFIFFIIILLSNKAYFSNYKFLLTILPAILLQTSDSRAEY